MAISATIRRSEPLLATPAITWPRTAVILDADGAPLTEVDMAGPAQGGRALLGDVGEPSALLGYVFGHGHRRVMLNLGDALVNGWLGTSWEGRRRSWWIEIDE